MVLWSELTLNFSVFAERVFLSLFAGADKKQPMVLLSFAGARREFESISKDKAH